MDFHVEHVEMCHGWVQGLNYENAFSLQEDSWELGVVMWPIIKFGYAMLMFMLEVVHTFIKCA
jgi:hypothetical protein